MVMVTLGGASVLVMGILAWPTRGRGDCLGVVVGDFLGDGLAMIVSHWGGVGI